MWSTHRKVRVRGYVKRAKAAGMLPELIDTSDDGGIVEISSDALPGSLTKLRARRSNAEAGRADAHGRIHLHQGPRP